MKHPSRRDFIHAGCTLVAGTLLDSATLIGRAAARESVGSKKVGQSVINAGNSSVAFVNLAKGFGLSSPTANFPKLLNADGFPTTSLSSSLSLGGACDPAYYGRYLIWWTGTACLQFGPQTIIYSGGNAVSGIGP